MGCVFFGWKCNGFTSHSTGLVWACVSPPQQESFSLSVRHHTMGQPSFVIPSWHLLLPGFSLARTRSIFISIHQARDEVRCYCYDERICNNREDSNAFENSIPNSCLNRNVLLVPPAVVRVKKNNLTDSPFYLSRCLWQQGVRICCFQTVWNERNFWSSIHMPTFLQLTGQR